MKELLKYYTKDFEFYLKILVSIRISSHTRKETVTSNKKDKRNLSSSKCFVNILILIQKQLFFKLSEVLTFSVVQWRTEKNIICHFRYCNLLIKTSEVNVWKFIASVQSVLKGLDYLTKLRLFINSFYLFRL